MSENAVPQFRLPSTFRALRHRNYRLFFFGQAMSLVGTWMQTIALQWLVYRLTGSAAMLATVNLAAAVPLAPVALWGGSLADRFPKRSILLVTQSVMMVLAFVLAVVVWMDVVQIWQVLVLAVITGAASALAVPVQQAFVVETVEGKEDLVNAIGLNSTANNAARAIGPVLAGISVATIGEAGAFLLNALTFVAIIIGLLLMRLPESRPPEQQPKLTAHVWEGVQYLRRRKTLLAVLSLVAVTAFLSRPYVVLLPVFAEDVLRQSAQPLLGLVCTGSEALFDCQSPNALTYGFLVAAMGLGAVTGALIIASLPGKARHGLWLTVSSLAFPALLVIMSFSRSFAYTSMLLVGIGLSFVAQTALSNSLIQLSVPDGLRGRMMSFYSLVILGMTRVGGIQAGIVGDLYGAQIAVGAGALVCLAYAVFVAWRFPEVRKTGLPVLAARRGNDSEGLMDGIGTSEHDQYGIKH